MPSTCGALTSVRRCRSARTAARSIFSIASASGASAVAAESVAADSSNAAACRVERIIVSPRSAKALQSQQLVDFSLAVRELVQPYANLVEQREVQVREWRWFGVLDVPPALHLSGAAAGDDDRQVDVIVNVRIAHAAAVE